MRADDFLFAAVQVLPAGGSARRQGTLRRYLPAAHTALRPMWKALCSRQQPAEVLPGMRPLHPAQAEDGLGQTATQRRTLSTGKALISKAFGIARRGWVAVSIRPRQNPLLTFYKGEFYGQQTENRGRRDLAVHADEQDDVHRGRTHFAGRQCHQRCQQNRQKLADAVAGAASGAGKFYLGFAHAAMRCALSEP